MTKAMSIRLKPDTTTMLKMWPHAAGLLAVAGAMAFFAPEPAYETDRGVYERMGREWLVPGCNDFHCFRPLVSWVLGRLPGPPIVIWKAYAVLAQVGAGLAMASWVMRWGVSASTARMVAWLTALGSGACYTLFDPFTSDPLMHLLAPVLMLLIDRGGVVPATAIAAVGVMAKEFAAVPIIVGAAYRATRDQWRDASRLAVGGAVVVSVWAGWQLFARNILAYTTGPTYSADFTTGGFLVFWLLTLSPSLVVTLMALVLGGLWLLWPAGLLRGPRELRQLTLASLPAILIFNALQQPDRALWNFAFIVMPAAALVLDRVPPVMGWMFVAAQAVLNARFGAQLLQLPPARISFTIAAILAAAIIFRARVGTPATSAA